MRIAQISPLIESVPPQLYGGTERIVSYLTEELVRRGHDVTLFASGDSRTAAELAPVAPAALRLAKAKDPLPYNVMQLEMVMRRAGEFDVLHFHTDLIHFPYAVRAATPALTTLHGRIDAPELQAFFKAFPAAPLVSISDAQRRPIPRARWTATVPHGLPPDLYGPTPQPRDYLAFLGRLSAEKQPDHAIAIAERCGLRLRIAAKVDPADQDYFAGRIGPLLSHPLVDFIGEITDSEKNRFLGGARALLFPIDWPEPFGLVMIEAMACGTPVIAYPCGSVREVIEDGVTGFIVRDVEEAAAAVQRVAELDRAVIRRRFEQRFTAGRMAEAYLAVYRGLIAERRRQAS
jgi:glycosyltransferase involved in cell wall biosynthesis